MKKNKTDARKKKREARKRNAKASQIKSIKKNNNKDRQAEKWAVDNILNIFFVACRRVQKFGNDRLNRLFNRMADTMDCIKGGYVTLRSIEREIYKEAGIDIDRSYANKALKNKDHFGKVQYQTLDRLGTIFLWALRIEFGYGNTVIMRIHRECAHIGNQINNHEKTYADLAKELSEGKGFTPVRRVKL